MLLSVLVTPAAQNRHQLCETGPGCSIRSISRPTGGTRRHIQKPNSTLAVTPRPPRCALLTDCCSYREFCNVKYVNKYRQSDPNFSQWIFIRNTLLFITSNSYTTRQTAVLHLWLGAKTAFHHLVFEHDTGDEVDMMLPQKRTERFVVSLLLCMLDSRVFILPFFFF